MSYPSFSTQLRAQAQPPTGLVEGELTLPAGVGPRVIDEAVAMQAGDVVYEIVAQKRHATELQIKYRALSRQEWNRLAAHPRHRWPLFPYAERMRLAQRRLRMLEVLFLALAGVSLVLATAWQLWEVGQMHTYAQRLRDMTPVVRPVTPGTQKDWAVQLNDLAGRVVHAGGRVEAFRCGPQSGQMRVSGLSSGQLRSLFAQAGYPGAMPLEEGLWAW